MRKKGCTCLNILLCFPWGKCDNLSVFQVAKYDNLECWPASDCMLFIHLLLLQDFSFLFHSFHLFLCAIGWRGCCCPYTQIVSEKMRMFSCSLHGVANAKGPARYKAMTTKSLVSTSGGKRTYWYAAWLMLVSQTPSAGGKGIRVQLIDFFFAQKIKNNNNKTSKKYLCHHCY